MGLGFARALRKAHAVVREHMPGEMLRQKKYHDTKVSSSSFETGDLVYVYFQIRMSGCFPKVTFFGRGPFEYRINCLMFFTWLHAALAGRTQ